MDNRSTSSQRPQELLRGILQVTGKRCWHKSEGNLASLPVGQDDAWRCLDALAGAIKLSSEGSADDVGRGRRHNPGQHSRSSIAFSVRGTSRWW